MAETRYGHILAVDTGTPGDFRYVAEYKNIRIDVTDSVKTLMSGVETATRRREREKQDAISTEERARLQRYNQILRIVDGDYPKPTA